MSQSFGVINADGNAQNSGSEEWQVQRTGPGFYTVTFGYPRPHVPVVIAGAFGNSNSSAARTVFSVFDVTKNGFRVVALSAAGTPQDAAFSFMATW
jgi:hypothetical protein